MRIGEKRKKEQPFTMVTGGAYLITNQFCYEVVHEPETGSTEPELFLSFHGWGDTGAF